MPRLRKPAVTTQKPTANAQKSAVCIQLYIFSCMIFQLYD